MARTSIRTSATRNQASSPPKRRTRSQSAEPQSTSQRPPPRRAGNRARQSSVESDRSDSSVQSISKRRKLRRGAADHELSIVDEGPKDDGEEVEYEEHNDEARNWALTETSPRESQYSGTTAYTSHSQEQMRNLDPESIVDHLPDLFSAACGVLDLLAPKKIATDNMDRSLEYVDGVLRDLKIPGSRLSKNLKRKEDLFQTNREHYGATEFIDLQLTLRKLFNTTNPSNRESRPDAIFYAANLATAVKDILVKPKENHSIYIHLRGLQAKFPQAFVSTFGEGIDVGKSNLLERSFDLALDILTQAVIADLLHPMEDEEIAFEPDNILASSFYVSKPESNLTIRELDKFYDAEPVLDILRHVPNSNAQKRKIRKRVEAIRNAFRYNGAAVERRDLVDYELLNDIYPWLDFITNMVIWSRLRLEELLSSVEEQGGAQRVAEALEEIVDVESSDHPALSPPRLQPAAEITSTVQGAKYMKKSQLLQKLLKPKEIETSEQIGARGKSRSSINMVSSSMAGPSRMPRVELSERSGNSQDPEEERLQSSDRAMVAWERDTKERNKENLRSYGTAITAHSNAVSSQSQLTGNGRTGDVGRSNGKRSRDDVDDEESDVSEDTGFQSDYRVPNPNKRVKLSANLPSQVGRFSNNQTRARSETVEPEEDDEITRQNRINLEKALQANAQEDDEKQDILSEVDEEDQQSVEEDVVPDSTQARAAARVATARAKVGKPPPVQTRKPWSAVDEEHLVNLIEVYGTSWAVLLQQSNFQREETQVGLKDKARNMKVAFLKAGIPPAALPRNFSRIALGKKEKRAVNAVRPGTFSNDY